ncbi:MAG: tetratricopeptide repeat protein [Trueperaceae bacterium]
MRKQYLKNRWSRLQGVAFLTLSQLMLLQVFGVAQESRNISDYIQAGNSFMAQGDCAFAQYQFQEALKLEEANVEALLGKGRSLVCQKALASGIEDYKKVLELDPNNVTAHIRLAEAYQQSFQSTTEKDPAQLTESLSLLEKAEGLASDNPEVLNAKGVTLYLSEDLAGARAALERAVSLAADSELSNRDVAQMHINLGSIYRDLDELELALASYRRAVALNPLSAQAHRNAGWAHYNLKNCEEAIYELTQAVNLNPQFLDAIANLGIAEFDCGNVEASIPHFEKALELPGALNLPPLYTYLSRAYVEQGKFEDAVKRAQQGALLPPVTAEALFYLGQAYEKRNATEDRENAREAYQSALEIDAEYKPAQDALGKLP